jgi:glycine hydroxymethyltransferase
LKEGADIVTGSAGKTFSGPQSGIILWDDPSITKAVTDAVFPIWAATHQVNRVAALAYSAAEFLEYGEAYMNQIVKNAQALGEALQERGIPMLASHKGFTRTHQVIADVRKFGGGLEVARQLESANIITNKNLLPTDSYDDWANPGGLRIGTIEVTRLGMREEEMKEIADFIARLLVQSETTEKVGRDVLRFRSSYQTLYYCFEHGLPE